MKIAILAPIAFPLPPTKYGPWEKVVNTLATGLTEKGIDVTVLSTAHTQGNFKHITTVEKTTDELPKENRFAYELHHITLAQKIIKQNHFDLIHNHLNWYGFLGMQNLDIPVLTTLHGMEDTAKFIYDIYKKEAKFISISNALRNYKPDLNYIQTVYNGIDFSTFTIANKKENYLFIASRICAQKGIHNAIQLSKQTTIPLIIAGIIDDQPYFDTQVKPHIDNQKIKYVGQLNQEEMHTYLAAATAYISLIEWEEPFGLSVAESIASGTPVIATKRGSMPELVKNGISGITVDSVEEAAHRINEIANIDSQTCRDFGQNLFSIDKMIEGYLQAYQKILE